MFHRVCLRPVCLRSDDAKLIYNFVFHIKKANFMSFFAFRQAFLLKALFHWLGNRVLLQVMLESCRSKALYSVTLPISVNTNSS